MISLYRRLSSILLFALCSTLVVSFEEFRCGSVDIRNHPKSSYQRKDSASGLLNAGHNRNCTVIEGDFSLSMITNTNTTEAEFSVFENLREITGYLLVFQVRGLKSLGKIFPNLRVIGGRTLIMNYALIIYQNVDIREIGLSKLTTIRNGGVRITENSRLCYSELIDWTLITTGSINDVLVDRGKNQEQCAEQCTPPTEQLDRCLRKDGKLACWDQHNCQIECPFTRESKASSPGCDPHDQRCHPSCVGGCSAPDDPSSCHACRFVRHLARCTSFCPDHMFLMLGRRCVTRDECQHLPVMVSGDDGRRSHRPWKAVDGVCHYNCPKNYDVDRLNSSLCIRCDGYCPKKCIGKHVDSMGDAVYYKGCNVVQGYLEIEMRVGMDSTAVEKLVEALGQIEEIDDYLLIRFSPSFVSLHMFRNLRLIRGKKLWRDRYALAVFENANLRQTFDIDRQPLEVERGTIQFQNNRMLCYSAIEKLSKHLGLEKNISDNDVSQFSNGDKAICNEINLDVAVVLVFDFGFVLQWTAFNTSDTDHRKFLGYQVFYKEVDGSDRDLSIDDERSACSDSWKMHFESDESRGTIVSYSTIQPNTWYAFYVQTKLVNHPGAHNAISRIQFVKTLFSVPDPPRVVKTDSPSPDAIVLEWDEPLRPNGDITHYIVSWTRILDDGSDMEVDYCSNENKKRQDEKKILRTRPRDEQQQKQEKKEEQNPLKQLADLQKNNRNSCPVESGCCDCKLIARLSSNSGRIGDKEHEEIINEEATFENAIQNVIFVQECVLGDLPLHVVWVIFLMIIIGKIATCFFIVNGPWNNIDLS